MITTDFLETLSESSSKLLPLGGLILAVVLVFYIWHRTSSGHPILRWIWSKLTGKSESKDPLFDKFMDGQDNLMQFRFVVGNARTLPQMHALIRWAEVHNEDVAQAFACGPYFDRERPALRSINRARTSALAVVLSLFAACIVLVTLTFGGIAFSGRGLVSTTETKTYLLLGKSSAQLVFDKRRLLPQDCNNPVQAADKSGLSLADTRIVCGEFAKGKPFEADVEKAIDETREAFYIFLVLVALPLILVCYRFISHASAALAMDYRLNRPRP